MGTPLTRKDRIISLWETTDDDTQRFIFNEFKTKHRRCYTERDLLNFLELKLMRPPAASTTPLNYCRAPLCLSH